MKFRDFGGHICNHRFSQGRGENFGISAYTYLEVLQGARNEQEYDRLKKYLSAVKIYELSATPENFEKAAQMTMALRRQGITPRNTIDILIALTSIVNKIPLLHNDRDFDYVAEKVSGLDVVA